MPKINKTKYAILGVLSLQPASGYDIKKFTDGSIAHFWNENFGHIYPVLRQLEREALIEKETLQVEGRPPRHVYSITKKGMAELRGWLLRPVERAPQRDELLLKIFFSVERPLDHTLAELEELKQRLAAILETLRAIERKIAAENEAEEYKSYPFERATVRFGVRMIDAKIAWCEETVRELRAAEKAGKIAMKRRSR